MKRIIAVLCLFSILTAFVGCKTEIKEEPPCNHSYGEWQVTVKSPDGLIYNEERVCIYCGDKEVKTTNLLDSVPSQWIEVFDKLITVKDNPVADIFYMDYASPEDRAARNGTPVAYTGKLIYDDRSYWSTYDTIPAAITELFAAHATPESPVAPELVKTYIGDGNVDSRQITALEEKYGKEILTEIYLNTLRFSDKLIQRLAVCLKASEHKLTLFLIGVFAHIA